MIASLETSGWVVDGDSIYAPARTIWFLCSDPWQGDLAEMLERMRGRLERIRRRGPFPGEVGYEESLADTGGLVQVLERLNGRG